MGRLRIDLVNIASVSGVCLCRSISASNASRPRSHFSAAEYSIRLHCLHHAAISISSNPGTKKSIHPTTRIPLPTYTHSHHHNHSPLPLLLLPLSTPLRLLPLLFLHHHQRRNPTPLHLSNVTHHLILLPNSSLNGRNSHTSHPPPKLPQHLHQPSYLGCLGGFVLEGYAACGVEGFED